MTKGSKDRQRSVGPLWVLIGYSVGTHCVMTILVVCWTVSLMCLVDVRIFMLAHITVQDIISLFFYPLYLPWFQFLTFSFCSSTSHQAQTTCWDHPKLTELYQALGKIVISTLTAAYNPGLSYFSFLPSL